MGEDDKNKRPQLLKKSELHDHRKLRDNTSDLFELRHESPNMFGFVLFFQSILKTTFCLYISLVNAYNSYNLTEKLSLIVLDW